ncbi:MAG: phage major capsid protein [Clostridia bacterium]
MAVSKGIDKTNVEALIETQVANEIFEGVVRESKALSMFRRLPNMTSDKTKLRVLDSLPITYFVDESTNNGRKNLTKMAWDKKYINAAELAVIVPIKENVLNDTTIDIWAEVKPRIVEAFGKKIDNAIFNGTDKPADWRAGLIPSIVTAGAEVTEGDNLYSDINDVMTKVEESGYNVTGLLGGVGLKGKFRMLTDTTGQPIKGTEIDSLPKAFLDNGAWDKTKSVLVAGDFSQAVYAIRQDVTYKVLTEAVIQDPSTGDILYNLAQDDMIALRVVMRLGWEIPNPVNALNETTKRFPFANLKPKTTASL